MMSPRWAAGGGPAETPIALVTFVMLLVSVALSVAGQLALKAAMDRVGRISSRDLKGPAGLLGRAAREPRVWFGLGLFGVSALFWLVVLSRVPLSVAYPFVGISYILIVLLARYALHERVPPLRWVGVVVVAAGIAVIGLSFRGAGG